MSLRLFAAVLVAAVVGSAAFAQTAPTPPATPTPPAAQASQLPDPGPAGEDLGRTTRAEVKACQAKWKVEKAKPGAKLGAKAFYTFMAGCL
jgi:hypothetical protein